MKIFKNFLYNILYQILIMILPLITAPYIARVLGAELIGVYSYTYSIAHYFVLFSQLGINVYGNRAIASVRDDKDKLNKTFSGILCMQLLISAICLCVYIGFVLFGTKEYKVYFGLQILYVIAGMADISWFYFGIEKFKLTVTRNALIKILTVVGILTCVRTKNDLYIYILIMASGAFIGQLLLWISLYKYVSFTRIHIAENLKHLKPIMFLFLPTVATSLYRVLDKIMLGSMNDISQLGYYENSEKFIAISMGVINALGMVMIPKMTNLITNGEHGKAGEYINKSIEGIYILASPLAFGLGAISVVLSVVFYGQDFIYCGQVISILASSILFSAWANVIRTQYLIPKNRDKEYIISMFCGAGANIVVNLALIPDFGAIGAAVGTVFAEAFVAVAHSLYVRKELPLKKYLRYVLPYCLNGVIMYLVVSNFVTHAESTVLALFCAILLGFVCYSLVTVIYLWISKGQYYFVLLKGIKRICQIVRPS